MTRASARVFERVRFILDYVLIFSLIVSLFCLGVCLLWALITVPESVTEHYETWSFHYVRAFMSGFGERIAQVDRQWFGECWWWQQQQVDGVCVSTAATERPFAYDDL